MSGTKRTKTLSLCFMALLFFLLFTQIPPFSDDWLWGSYKSFQTFLGSFRDPSNPWHDYPNNGRYLGNFLGFIGANHFWIRNLIMTAAMCSMILVISNICDLTAGSPFQKSVFYLLIGSFLLGCQGGYFTQVMAWSSSFMNYVVPSVLLLLSFYLLLTQEKFEKGFGIQDSGFSRSVFHEEPVDPNSDHKNGSFRVIFFLLPFISAFFMENLTIANLLFIVLWIAYRFLRKEKPAKNECAYLFGALTGLILMFADDGYRQVFDVNDTEKIWGAQMGTLPFMLQTALLNFQNKAAVYMILDNPLLTFFGACSICLFCLLFREKTGGIQRKILPFLGITDLLIGIYYLIRLFEPSWRIIPGHTGTLEAALTVIHFLIIPAAILSAPLPEKQKTILLWSFIFLICINLPLLLAQPLTIRVFYPALVFMLLLYGELTRVNISEIQRTVPLSFGKWPAVILAAVFMILWGFRISVYAVVNHYEIERVKYLRYQESIGADPILLPKLPYTDYVVVYYPDGDLWQERYKRFYGLDIDRKYELISFEDWRGNSSAL